jgi:hypothetical protein
MDIFLPQNNVAEQQYKSASYHRLYFYFHKPLTNPPLFPDQGNSAEERFSDYKNT